MDTERHFGGPKGTAMLRQEIIFYSPFEENENHKDSEKKWKEERLKGEKTNRIRTKCSQSRPRG